MSGHMTFHDASAQKIEPGTVIGVRRRLYDHYGVMSTGARIIHYTSSRSDLGSDIRVRQTGFEAFLRGNPVFWSVQFPSREEARQIIALRYRSSMETLPVGSSLWDILFRTGGKLFADAFLKDYDVRSPGEILNRAESRLGERKYNLVTRNCEHFAFWCATGLSTSQQVEAFLRGGASLLLLFIRTIRHPLIRSLTILQNIAGWRPLFTRDRVFRFASELPDDLREGIGCDSHLHGTGTSFTVPENFSWGGSVS